MLPESQEQFLSGGGEMGRLIRTMDWSKTALGPVENWPQSLRTSVSLCLSSTFPILIAWGPETIQIYNDSYRPICGAKHPASMGQNFRICWETALPVVGDKFTRGQQGEGTYITDQRMFLDRYGYLEESWMTFSFAPIRDESGGVGGIFHPITESTEKMLSARRTQVLRDLGAAMGKAKNVQEIGAVTQAQYQDHDLDLPFLLFYQISGGQADLISSTGFPAGSALAPRTLDTANSPWPVPDDQSIEFKALQQHFGEFSCGPYEQAPHTAMILPVRITGRSELFGFLVAGVSACRAMDQAYMSFYEQLAATFNTAVTNVYAYEQELKRAEALAEIDRSKTAFFSNVSHEFRTPLTLMLGPLEELLANQELDATVHSSVDATHRNALRLLKLVNNLLDYSRVEAGRVLASYEPLDLAVLTADLASSFRSIIEKAGMALVVDTEKPNDAVYADRQMWEKIVLNLLSNAFKYTLQGQISVSLRQKGPTAVLRVSDTGVGIPEKELPHMFERFHRIENSAGRTHEGTGIGLSLVHELVNLHGGNISVESIQGSGSTFTVELPVGKAHLPAAQVTEDRTSGNDVLKGAFLREAVSLLEAPGTETTRTTDAAAYEKDTRILVVDDNADMRAYLHRLLEPHFEIATANNGADALERLPGFAPDLVLSDVMMPVMDGKALLSAIRQNAATANLPLIFLSARAGEEARIDGLEAGADDYLVKPFSAAELLTKVRAQIKIDRARGQAEQQLRELLIQAPVAIAIYRGPSYRIELANDRMLSYWDKDATIIGEDLFHVLPELKDQGFGAIMDKIYQTGERFVSGEIPIHFERRPDAFISLTLEALRHEQGQITGIMAVAADVTDQVIARRVQQDINEKLQIAHQTVRNIVHQAPVAMGLFRGDDMVIEEINQSFLELWDKDRSVIGKAIIEALPEMEGQEYPEIMRRVYLTGETYYANEAKVYLHRRGTLEEGYYDFINQAFRDPDGAIGGVIVIAHEVTEQVRAGRELKETTERLQAAINATALGTWTLEADGETIWLSDRALDIHGIRRGEEPNLQDSYQLILPEYREMIRDHIRRLRDEGGSFQAEFQLRPMDGSPVIWLRSTGQAAKVSQEPPVITGMILDITEQKADDQRKNDFIGMVSHELKTPLTSLHALVQVIGSKLKNSDDQFMAGAADKAAQQVRKMTAMINGFLNVSRLESGKLQLNKITFRLDELITEQCEELLLTTRSHVFNWDSCTETEVNADRDKIGSVISNLLGNAVKYSPKGKEVSIACHIDKKEVRVSVRDQGMGIAAEDIDHLFDRYFRAAGEHTQHIAGFGIGLYLSSEIVRHHGGRIWAESEPGNGSVFHFTLPLQEL